MRSRDWNGPAGRHRRRSPSRSMHSVGARPLVHCHLRRSQEAEAALRQQLAALQTRQAGLQAAVCAGQAENLQLRQALHTAKQAAEPSVVQLRQLLLDPAVNRCARSGWAGGRPQAARWGAAAGGGALCAARRGTAFARQTSLRAQACRQP